jgi:hypothetical protein
MACPPALDKIALLIDQIDGETARRTDGEGDDERFTNCGWCPEDSWMEGYLFAVEFLRVCQAEIDPIEMIEMLKLCCGFQVLRSLSGLFNFRNGRKNIVKYHPGNIFQKTI